MIDALHMGEAVNKLYGVWQARDVVLQYEPLQAARVALPPARRFAGFSELRAYVECMNPEQGWAMQPSAIAVLLSPTDALPVDAPWLAAEFKLPGNAGLSIRHDGHAFVCAHIEELADNDERGEEALCMRSHQLVSPGHAVSRVMQRLCYRVIHTRDDKHGWRPVAARFCGFESARGGKA